VIKVDIEGTEFDFLKGAYNTIMKQRDLCMIIEFNIDIIMKTGNTPE
jgi:hypothetical protein